jgi:MFS family permease
LDAVPHSIGIWRRKLLFATFMFGMMAHGMLFSAIGSVLPQMALDLGDRGDFNAQMIMASAAMGLLAGTFASGWILQRVGARITLIAAALVYGLSGAGGLAFHDPVLLLSTRLVVGFACACLVNTCVSGMSEEYQGTDRASALGVSSALANLTGVGSIVVGGYLAEVGGWRLAFLQYPIFGLIGALLAFSSVNQARARQVETDPRTDLEAEHMHIRQFVPFYLLIVFLSAVLSMGSTQFAFLLQEDGIQSSSSRSLIMSARTVASAIVGFCYGSLQKQVGAPGTFILGLSSMAAALAVLGWERSAAYAILGALLMGIYTGALGPCSYQFVIEHANPGSRNRAISLSTASAFLGSFLNPVVLATISHVVGLRNVFLVMSASMAAIAVGAATKLARHRGGVREGAASR